MHIAELLPGGFYAQHAAARLPQKVNLHPRVIFGEFKARGSARVALKANATQAVESILGADLRGGGDAPAFTAALRRRGGRTRPRVSR